MKYCEYDAIDLGKKLENYKEYFDNMFKKVDPNIILDEQQRTAVLLDSNNLLVIAGAGSGKTTTMVAKVIYLIEKCGYKESEIVVLSFTRKVKKELEDIIHNKFGYKGVNIFTFHKLGLRIINASGENYNNIVEENGQYSIFSDHIKNILYNDKEKFEKFLNAFSNLLYFNNEWRMYDTFSDYHDFEYKKEMIKNNWSISQYNEVQIEKRKNVYKTIRGEYLKSKEEVDIANFLFKNGIDYEYEKREENGEWYHPDFYIRQLENENYIEHFGIDENGHNKMFTEEELASYLESYRTKQFYFNDCNNRDKFIVTYSKYDNGSDYLTELEKELKKRGYSLTPTRDEEIYEKLKATDQDKYISQFISKLLIPFISLYKQQGYTYYYFNKLISENTGNIREQLIILQDFFKYYQEELEKRKLLDFEDMIYKSYSIMPRLKESNLKVDYKYLIIDEYQDISQSRLKLVKRLANLFDAKVMAVGDDWQTIFGYSGARIDLFKNFESEMEDAARIPIERTYRNSQELIDIAGEFILKNKEQIIKKLISDKHIQYPVEIVIYDDSDREKLNYHRALAVEKILDYIVSKDPNSKVLFMGRYKKDVYKISNNDKFKVYKTKVISNKYPELKIDYLTIHQAKGLGYDYCVLLDLNDGTYGFPSKIEDFPVVKLIKPEIDEPIDYPEERRLFYVALTRTRNKIYLLVPKRKISSFAKELENYSNVKINENVNDIVNSNHSNEEEIEIIEI